MLCCAALRCDIPSPPTSRPHLSHPLSPHPPCCSNPLSSPLALTFLLPTPPPPLPRPLLPAEYFIPAGILLKCFMEVSDREMYDKLVHSVQGVSRSRPCSLFLFLFAGIVVFLLWP